MCPLMLDVKACSCSGIVTSCFVYFIWYIFKTQQGTFLNLLRHEGTKELSNSEESELELIGVQRSNPEPSSFVCWMFGRMVYSVTLT